MRALKSFLLLAGVLLGQGAASAAPSVSSTAVQSAVGSPQTAPKSNCRREPIWGFRMSPFCKPTGICSDRVIKGYRTVCS